MTTPSSPRPRKESNFGSFAFGVTVGVSAALLLGTEEGRQFASKLLDTIKENLNPSLRGDTPARQPSPTGIIAEPESTPHTATYTPPPVFDTPDSR